jgi:cold shock CspA family protein
MSILQQFFGDTEPKEDPIESPDERRVKGKIIKVSEEGWGFITSIEIKFTRIFFHWTSLKQETLNFKDLKQGMEVEFTPIEVQDKGWRAIRIEVIQ